MKREKLNSMAERDLLMGLITSDDFCREIVPILDFRDLDVDYTRTIARWIAEYYNEFGVAPGSDISKIYRSHADDVQDEALLDNIRVFIEKVDEHYSEYEKFNVPYAIQQSVQYLKNQSLKNLAKNIDSFIATGDVVKAESLVTKYRNVEKNSGDSVSILEDSQTVLTAFTEEKDKLFSFKGDFGKLVGEVHREDFIAYLAPMKAGKTFSLIDTGIEAIKNGLKVVFFSLEMSRTAMIQRVWKALSGQVMEDMDLDVPQFVEDGNGRFDIEVKKVHKNASTSLEVEKKQKSMMRMFRGGNIYMFAEPAYSLTVERMETKLDDLEHMRGYIPDVIIVDYADIMCPSDARMEYRNQLDSIWKKLRALAQKRKCAVFTASQTNRGGLNGPVEMENVAEDVRKLAHVTSMVAISRTKFCKEHSIAYFSQMAIRDGEPITRRVIATQCLGLGRPVLDSHWENLVNIKEEDDDNSEKKDKKSKNNYKNRLT